ncbi:UDP-glucuronic acid decarboxylase family protein [Acidobacteriota bacterium]
MRILITGGAGFIGSHLCERLLAEGQEVICMDNFFTGRKSNIAHLMNGASFELIRHDVILPILLEVDQIYHLACPASPIHYQYNPVKTTKVNVMGTLNMLGMAKRIKARILLASTSEVYGDPQINPQTEDYWGHVNPIGPRSCYDEGKRVAETLMMDYHRQNKVDIKIVRIFNTYGPRMLPNDGRVVSNFIVQALKNEAITIYGDGSQTRSFCYIDDLIDGLIKMMNYEENPIHNNVKDYTNCALSGFTGPINLGCPEETSILDLAKLIIYLTKSKSEIIFTTLPEDDPKRRQPDISLAVEKMNWSPEYTLDEGIDLTIKYFEQL